MENTECFEIINRLSVRIAKDESDQLKGSGILFLRQVGEMAVVFTAAHVIIDIFKEGESQILYAMMYWQILMICGDMIELYQKKIWIVLMRSVKN